MDFYYLLLIIYLGLFLGLTVFKFKQAVCLVIFALPSYLIRFKVLGLPMTLLEAMLLILFIVWLLDTVLKKRFDQVKEKIKFLLKIKVLLAAILFLLSATLSVFISPKLTAAAGLWKAYFIEPFLFWLIFIDVADNKLIKKVFYSLGGSAIILSVIAFYQKISGQLISNPFWAAEATRRVNSVFPYPNALALYLAPIFIIGLYMFLKMIDKTYNNSGDIKKRLKIIFWWTVVLFSALAIYFTKSKGAWLAILTALVGGVYFNKGRFKKALIMVLFILCFFVLGLWLTDKVNLSGMATVAGGDSISVRLEMWRETWQMLKGKWLTGAGLAGYQSAVQPFHSKPYIEIYLYPHNIIFNFWSEIGMWGLIAFGWLVFIFYRTAYKLANNSPAREYYLMLLSVMTVILVHGLVDVPYFKNDLSLFFWLVIGFLNASQLLRDREKSANKL